MRILTLKVTLLLVLASFKRVGDLQALSVSESCTEFAPVLVKAFLRPIPGYVPKVLFFSVFSFTGDSVASFLSLLFELG